MQPYNFILFRRITLLALCLLIAQTAQAKWSVGGSLSTYYTDDVGLFSVTRRLSLDEDPTQPIVDEPDQGSDAVYEPNAYINWDTENQLGEFQLSVDAGGYIFQNHSDYTHGFFQLAIEQSFAEKTILKLYYDFIPELFLGKNSIPQVQHSNSEEHDEHEADEQLSSHLLTMQLEQELTKQLTLRGLVRYGIRLYNQPFSYRDTQFFTIGSHLEWIITHDIELLVGYHFERGYTDEDETIKFQDDIGYINHFASAELKIHLLDDLILNAIFDYEHNDFTSSYKHDIHHNGNENVYQGELELLYEIAESTTLKVGWQHGKRKFNYESHSVRNNNVWIGAEFHF
ncbi:MAG: outer membrane beta-barrel protein [Methyloprofundus sp.]|nr:outer membrane beta-barrel protein [Methyloprofundus sp.]